MSPDAWALVHEWQFQVSVACLELLYLLFTAHALLGIVRTLATKRPYRRSFDGFYMPLFQGDYTIKLYPFSGWFAKTVKVSTLAVVFVLFGGLGLPPLLIWTRDFNYVWLNGVPGNLTSWVLVRGAHYLFIFLVLAYAFWRGLRGARVRDQLPERR